MFTNWWRSLIRFRRRSRKPRAGKSIRRMAYLDSELLEKRELFSSSPWLAQRPFSLTAAANFDQDPWLAPLGVVLTPLNAVSGSLTCISFHSTSTFSYDLTGSFALTLHFDGSDASHTFVFDGTGTETYTVHTAGSIADGVYSYDSYSFNQNAVISWNYSQASLGSHGWSTFSTGGTNTISSLATNPFDVDHWYVYNWLNALSQLSSQLCIGWVDSWSSFSAGESGGYSFTNNESTTLSLTLANPQSIGGNPVNSPPGGTSALLDLGMPGGDTNQTSQTSYTYTRLESYSYANAGTGTFTLHEEGSGYHAASLSSIRYDELGTSSTSLGQTGAGTVTGTTKSLATTIFTNGVQGGSTNRSDTYDFTQTGSFSYNEHGNVTATLHEAGAFGGGSLNLSSVRYEENGNHSSSFASDNTLTYNGTSLSTSSSSGTMTNANSYGYQSFSSSGNINTNTNESYTYRGSDTYAYRSGAVGTYHFDQAGQYAASSYALSSVNYIAHGQNTFTNHRNANQTYSGGGLTTYSTGDGGSGASKDQGTSSGGNGTLNLLSVNSFNVTGTAAFTGDSIGTWTYDLSAQECYANSSYSLGSIVYSQANTNSYTNQQTSNETYAGSGHSSYTQSGTNTGTTSYGGATGVGGSSSSKSGQDDFSYTGAFSGAYTEFSAATHTVYMSGVFAGYSYNLGSVLYTDNSQFSSTYSTANNQSYSGSGSSQGTYSSSSNGTTSYGGANSNGTSTASENRSDSYSNSGLWTYNYSVQAATTYSATQGGNYAQGSLALSSVVFQTDYRKTEGYNGASNDSYTGVLTSAGIYSGSGAGINDGSGIIAVARSGNGTLTQNDTSTYISRSSTTYSGGSVLTESWRQGGSFANGTYNLSSVLYQESGVSSSTYAESGNSTYTGTGSSTQSDNGPGSYTSNYGGATGNGSSTSTSNSSDAYSFSNLNSYTNTRGGNDTYTLYEAGNAVNGSYSFSSVVYTDNGSGSWTRLANGNESSSGNGQGTITASGTMAGSSVMGAESGTSNGTYASTSFNSYAKTSRFSFTDNTGGTWTHGEYQAGTYAQASYNLGSVVFDDAATSTGTYDSSGSQNYSGTGSSSYSSNGGGNQTGAYGGKTSTSTGTNSSSGQDRYTYASFGSQTYHSAGSDTWSEHTEGRFANGSYSFDSAVYQESGIQTVTATAAGSNTANGSGTSSETISDNGGSNAAVGVMVSAGTGSSSLHVDRNYSYTNTTTYSESSPWNANYANTYLGGKSGNGSTSYTSVVMDYHSDSSYTLQQQSVESNSGSAHESFTGSGSATGCVTYSEQQNSGTGSYSSNGNSTFNYANLGTRSIDFHSDESYTAHWEGLSSYGAYNLPTAVFHKYLNSTETNDYDLDWHEDGTGTSHDSQVNTGAGSASYGIAQNGGNANGTVVNDSSYSFTADGISHAQSDRTLVNSQYHSGSWTNGTYSFNSVVLSDTVDYHYLGTDESTRVQRNVNSYTSDGTLSGTQTATLGGGTKVDEGQRTFHEEGGSVSNGTTTYGGESLGTQHYTWREAGTFAGGSYAMTSVLYQANGSNSWSSEQTGREEFTLGAGGTVTSAGTNTQAGTYGPAGIGVSGTSGDDGGYVLVLDGNSSFTYNGSGNSSYTDYQAGQGSNGSYNLSSVVYTETGQDSFTNATELHQNFGMTRVGTDSDSSQSTLTAGSGVGLYDIRSLQLDGTYEYDADEDYTSSSSGASSYSFYRAGTWQSFAGGGNQVSAGVSGGVGNYGSVVNQWGDSGEYSETDLISQTWTGDGTGTSTSNGTETSGALTGGERTSDTAPFSYTLSANSTLTAEGEWSSSNYRAGQWSNGSYSFSSAVHDEHAENSASYERTADFSRYATGTWVNVRTGISTSGVNGTFLYSADGSAHYFNEGGSNECYTTHEEGQFANGSWSVGSMVHNAESDWDSDYAYYGNDSATNTTGFSIDGSFSGSGGQVGSWSVHKEGTASAGSWNLSSYVERSGALDSATSERDESQTATGESSTSTYTFDAIGTYSLYRAGTQSNGSYSFGSFNLDYRVTTEEHDDESGNNASYTDYTRADSDLYSYVYTEATGGNYTQNSLETITRDFDADKVGGGTVHNSSLVTVSYTNTGTRGQGSGAIVLNDAGGMRAGAKLRANGETAGTGGTLAAEDEDFEFDPVVDAAEDPEEQFVNFEMEPGDDQSRTMVGLTPDRARESGIDPNEIFGEPSQKKPERFDPNNIPASRVEEMIEEGLAYRFSADLVVITDVQGNQYVHIVLERDKSTGNYRIVYWKGIGPVVEGKSISDEIARLRQDKPIGVTLQLYFSDKKNNRIQGFANGVVFVYGILPFGKAWMNAADGKFGSAVFDATQDFLTLLTLGAGGATGVGCRTLRMIYAADTAFNAGVGGVRGVQAYFAFKDGDNDKALGYLGEAILRLLGASASAIAMMKIKCLPAGTLVATEHGLKKIEQIKCGDKVWALDFERNEWQLKPVLETSETKYQGNMVTLRVGAEGITATSGHPFWVVRGARLAERPEPGEGPCEAGGRIEGRWVLAGDVEAGDELLLHSGDTITVEEKIVEEQSLLVYNLRILGLPNFAIGCSGVLVHNGGPCDEALKLLREAEQLEKEGKTAQAAAKRAEAERLAKIEQHHSDPIFMGGDPKQKTTPIPMGYHRGAGDSLHNDFYKFLEGKVNAAGKSMRPTRGYPGIDVRRHFSREELLQATAEFYKTFRDKYPDVARDFFKLHPNLE